jgi:hypothetical protein
MAKELRYATVKGANPERFVPVDVDFTTDPFFFPRGFMLEDDFRASLRKQGMTLHEIEATVRSARENCWFQDI